MERSSGGQSTVPHGKKSEKLIMSCMNKRPCLQSLGIYVGSLEDNETGVELRAIVWICLVGLSVSLAVTMDFG